jgi:aspartate/methionine/tyrosine aminotransferase
MISLSRDVSSIEAPPIAEAVGWLRHMRTDKPLLNFCQAVPSYPPAAEVQKEIARLALEPSMGGYTDVLGIKPLREALARHFSDAYGANVAFDCLGVTAGCNQAFAAVMMAIAESGSNIVMPTPWYFNHHMWLRMLRIEARGFPAFSEGQNYPDVDAAAALIDKNTRAIMLCSPNNPSGAIYPAPIIEAFHDLAMDRGIALIVDETYKDFRPTNEPAHGILQRAGWEESFIQLHSFSKIYALAGYRLGAIVAGPRILSEAEKVLDCMTICPPQITQRAVLFGLDAVTAWKEEKRAIMRHRLDMLRDSFARNALTYQLVSSGSYFAYVRHPFEGVPSKTVAQRLAQELAVLSLPGSMFGPGQDQYLRFAFANMDAEFMPGLVDRLVESQTAFKW